MEKGMWKPVTITEPNFPSERRLMVTLTTTLSEMNRLYGAYYDSTCRKDSEVAEQAWKAYVEYVRRYKDERGLL